MQSDFGAASVQVSKPARSNRQRLQARAAHLAATCAMGAWFLLGIIPVIVILYSMS